MKPPKYNSPKFKLTSEYEYVQVERPSAGTASDTGETGVAWAEVYAETKVAIHPLSNVNKANMQALSQGTNWNNYRLAIFEWGVDIQVRDRITQYDSDIWFVYDCQPYPNTHTECIIQTREETA